MCCLRSATVSDKVTGTFSVLGPRPGMFWTFVRWLAFAMQWSAERLEGYGYVVIRKVHLHDENLEFIDESAGK